MFTGLIEGRGRILKLLPRQGGLLIELTSEFPLSGSKVGDSIAVDGVCLTATSLSERGFTAEISPETLSKTTFKYKKPGDWVNLERALRLGDPLGGHLVSGHVDGLGKIANLSTLGDYHLLEIEVPEEFSPYLIPKGSIALDGISLTINEVSKNLIRLMIIPHTFKVTTLSLKRIGDWVNLEVDLLAKMVYQWAQPYLERLKNSEESHLSLEFLKRHGFL